jgi:hypothetical protein
VVHMQTGGMVCYEHRQYISEKLGSGMLWGAL